MSVSASLPASKWHKLSELIVCFYVVHNVKKRTSSKVCMFCPVLSSWIALSLISCVIWIFFNSVSDMYIFFFSCIKIYKTMTMKSKVFTCNDMELDLCTTAVMPFEIQSRSFFSCSFQVHQALKKKKKFCATQNSMVHYSTLVHSC